MIAQMSVQIILALYLLLCKIRVLKLVYRLDLKSSDLNHVGSNPSSDRWKINDSINTNTNNNNNTGEIIEYIRKVSKFVGKHYSYIKKFL
jgi:hypothetical protein